jgi:hypothetical protein
VIPKIKYISLRDLSILINGLIIIFYRQQTYAYSEIQDIHDTLISPPKQPKEGSDLIESDSKAHKSKRTRAKTTARRKANAQNFQLMADLSQLLTHRHYMFQSLGESEDPKKRYSDITCMSAMSVIHNQSLVEDNQIIENPEMEFGFNEDPLDNLSFSITQGLQALKEQLNIDINDIIKNGQILDENSLPFHNFDINNPEISNLLLTPPTMGTQLHTFRQEHDLRNAIPEGISSQSSSSDGKISVDKNFNKMFEKPIDEHLSKAQNKQVQSFSQLQE